MGPFLGTPKRQLDLGKPLYATRPITTGGVTYMPQDELPWRDLELPMNVVRDLFVVGQLTHMVPTGLQETAETSEASPTTAADIPPTPGVDSTKGRQKRR